MRMTITTSFPGMDYMPTRTVDMGESGWQSVEEMRKELKRRFRRLVYADIPNGIRCYDSHLNQQQDITLCSTKQTSSDTSAT
jgi:hypothetical protein